MKGGEGVVAKFIDEVDVALFVDYVASIGFGVLEGGVAGGGGGYSAYGEASVGWSGG